MPAETGILDELERHAADRTDDGGTRVIARHGYRLAAVACDQPLLVVPLCGRKRVHCGSLSLECGRGAFVAIRGGSRIDVENLPGDDDAYRALCIGMPWRCVSQARAFLERPPSAAMPVAGGEANAIRSALHEWVTETRRDAATLDFRRVGLLLALARAGHDALLDGQDPGLAARVRAMVAEHPALDWTSARFEDAFHVSGATLRRRLAEEGTSLRETVREARLHAGLAQLQAGTRTLAQVALAVGYRSAPTFARHFRERFGAEAALVDGHAGD